MLEQYYTREYLYEAGDMNTGFILRSDEISDFHFCKVEDEEQIQRILSGCVINFDDCDEKIKKITFEHLRRLFAGERDSWVITQINPRPGELRVEMEIPELATVSDYGYFLEKYLPVETCSELSMALDEWYDGRMTLDFSFSDDGPGIYFYKKNSQGKVRDYHFYVHLDSDWSKNRTSLYIGEGSGNARRDEEKYHFRWKDEARKNMIAEITEVTEL